MLVTDRDPGGDSLSGAYLFLPDGPSKTLSPASNSFIRLAGPVRQTIIVRGPVEARVQQDVRLDTNALALDIVNTVDVRETANFELVMRIKSNALDTQERQFYTDLNGLEVRVLPSRLECSQMLVQMIRRKRFEKLPIQAQFYPMPSAAFVEADGRRLTLLGRQAVGIAAMSGSTLEIMLERRLMQDDQRGVAQVSSCS